MGVLRIFVAQTVSMAKKATIVSQQNPGVPWVIHALVADGPPVVDKRHHFAAQDTIPLCRRPKRLERQVGHIRHVCKLFLDFKDFQRRIPVLLQFHVGVPKGTRYFFGIKMWNRPWVRHLLKGFLHRKWCMPTYMVAARLWSPDLTPRSDPVQ